MCTRSEVYATLLISQTHDQVISMIKSEIFIMFEPIRKFETGVLDELGQSKSL